MGNQAPIGTGLFKLAYDDSAKEPTTTPQKLLFDSVE